MRCSTVIVLSALSLIACSRAESFCQEQRVGPLGDPARLAVRGALTIPPQQIVQALFADIDVAYASFSEEPLSELKRLLVTKTVAGYLHCGFPQPRVTVSDRLDHLELTIHEGTRWMAGEVRVIGAKGVDARELVLALSPDHPSAAPRAASGDTIWPVGKPAHLDEQTRQRLSRRVKELLAKQGYAAARFDVGVLDDRDTAILRIAIHDEGPPLRLRDVEIEGNKLHSREQILNHLGMPPEAILSNATREEIEHRLEASGRFTKVAFRAPPARATPQLALEEFAEAPRLDEPLTPEESALVKLAQWIGGFSRQDSDLVIDFDAGDKSIRLVMSPRGGFLATVATSRDPPEPCAFDTALVCDAGHIALYSSKQSQKLVFSLAGTRVVPILSAVFVTGSPEFKGENSISYRLSFGKRSNNLQASVAPKMETSAAISLTRKHHAVCRWDGSVLSAEWNSRTLRVDSRDGRLIELREAKKRPTFFFKNASGGIKSLVTTADGLFQRRTREIEQRSAGFANVCDSRRPVSSSAEFLCQVLADQEWFADDDARRLLFALQGLARRGMLQAFDDLTVAASRTKPDRFAVPGGGTSLGNELSVRFSGKDGVQLWFHPTSAALADTLFSRGTRPWLAWREAAFIRSRKAAYSAGRLTRLLPPDERGPVTDLLLAQAAQSAELTDQAKALARQGSDRLSIADFRKDYGDLLVGDRTVSTYLSIMAQALRGLRQDQAEALCDYLVSLHWMSRGESRHARRFLNELSADEKRPLSVALGAAFDVLWQSELRKKVMLHLFEIDSALPPISKKESETRRRKFLFPR